MRIAVIGLGAVGSRAARQLVASEGVDSVLLRDLRAERVEEVAASLGPKAVAEAQSVTAPPDADAVVLAGPPGDHAELALELIARDTPVISVSGFGLRRRGPARSRPRGGGPLRCRW